MWIAPHFFANNVVPKDELEYDADNVGMQANTKQGKTCMIERCGPVGEEAVTDEHHVAVDGEEDDLTKEKLIFTSVGGPTGCAMRTTMLNAMSLTQVMRRIPL